MMIKEKLKFRGKAIVLSACLFFAVVGMLFVSNTSGIKDFFLGNSDIEITVRDFTPGTRVGYEILADANIIESGQKILEKNGVLKLPLPKELSQNDNVKMLNYRLHMESPDQGQTTPAETLDLLLGLNKETGNVSVSGSGLDVFSDVIVKKGTESGSLTRACNS